MAATHIEYLENTQTLIGTKRRELADVETGERIWVDQITKRVYGTKQFWKVYLMDFLMVLGIIDSKQLDVFVYVCENTDPKKNLFIGTYKKIAADVGVTEPTISKIFRKLQDNGFVKRVQNGVWFVNPNILMKGGEQKRQILLSYYENDEPIDQLTFKRTKRGAFGNEGEDSSDLNELDGRLNSLLPDNGEPESGTSQLDSEATGSES